MTESLQSPYLAITLDTFFTHICRYVASTLMLCFCMNPYATSFASSPPHGMYSHSIMFSHGTLRGNVLLSNMSEDHSLKLQLHGSATMSIEMLNPARVLVLIQKSNHSECQHIVAFFIFTNQYNK
jgi:hypothetical protein